MADRRMGFEWGPPEETARWDTYTGRPLPPWPPTGVIGNYQTCLGCPRRQRCADCPCDQWEGKAYTPPPAKPERREPLLTRLFRKVTRK